MAHYTKKLAKEILDQWKDKTAYFDKSLTRAQFESMRFGEAEATVITMALILAGAKFAD